MKKRAWIEEILPQVVNAPPGVQRLAESRLRRVLANELRAQLPTPGSMYTEDGTAPPADTPRRSIEAEIAKEAALNVFRELSRVGRD